MTWRVAELAREAVRNCAASPARTLGLAAVVGATVFGAAAAELAVVGDLATQQRAAVGAGSEVVVVSDDGAVAAAPCLLLDGQAGVRAAGTALAGPARAVSNAPGSLVQTGWASQGALSIWTDGRFHPAAPVSGWVVGADAAAELGLQSGSFVQIGGGDVARVDAVVDTEVRNPAVGRWFQAVGSSTEFVDDCWVEFEPGIDETGSELLQATFGVAGTGVRIQPYLIRDDIARTPLEVFDERVTRFGWVVGGVIIFLVALLVARSRRAEIGLYRAMGTSVGDLYLMAQVEALLIVMTAGSLGFLWALALFGEDERGTFGGMSLDAAIHGAVAVGCIALLVAPLAWLTLARGSIVAQIKGE